MIHRLKTKGCAIVFALSLVAGAFMIPREVLGSPYAFIAIPFVLLFALTMTCVARGTKDKFLLARSTKTSVLGVLASVIGLSALQVCGISAAMCGATVGTGIVATIFPGVLFHLLHEYSIPILFVSMLLQLFALWHMGCFGKGK